MSTCAFDIACQDIQEDMERLGVTLTCERCVDAIVGLAIQGGKDNALILAKIGLLEAAVLAAREKADLQIWEEAICVHTRMHPVGQCTTKSCLAWINYPETGNCFRVFARSPRVNIRDISVALDLPETETKEALTRGRALAAVVYIEKESSQKEVPKTEGICCNCGSLAELEESGFWYCGQTCLVAKPPFIAGIERRFKMPIAAITKHLRSFPRAVVSSALGIDDEALDYLQRNMGLPLETALARRQARHRKYASAWQTLLQFAQAYYLENGPPIEDGSRIRDQIDSIIDTLWR